MGPPMAAIALTTQGGRLLTPATGVPSMYSGQVLSTPGAHFSHIQIQPKSGHNKAISSNKVTMHPMSLTIPIMTPGGIAAVTPQQPPTLLLQTEDSRRQHELAPQVQNSPSTMMS